MKITEADRLFAKFKVTRVVQEVGREIITVRSKSGEFHDLPMGNPKSFGFFKPGQTVTLTISK